MQKVYCVRKYIKAEDVLEALQKERHTPVHEVFIDDGWMRNAAPNLSRMMGVPYKEDDFDDDRDTIK